MNVYILGNPLIEKDSLPLKILPLLKESFSKITFLHLDPTEEMPHEEHFILIDAVEGIKEVTLFDDTDIEKFVSSPQVSWHDFDLGFQLKLSKKVGTIQKITIIGVPMGMDEEEAFRGVKGVVEEVVG